MLTKAELKQIHDLQRSRERQRLGLFVCEGHKLIGDMLGAYICKLLIAERSTYETLRMRIQTLPPAYRPERIELVESSFDFGRISSLRTPQPVLAVFALPEGLEQLPEPRGLALLLDDVQDPGNVGTLLRTADWFGLSAVYLSPASADPYSPKVLQATMGAMSRLRVIRLSDTEAFLRSYPGEILGTFLSGDDLYTLPPADSIAPRLLVLGNEGNGISSVVASHVTQRITIPAYAPAATGSESLNVAIAGAICISELRRGQQASIHTNSYE
ncbi:MAG: RNA methyltransferase [Porphyromonas sp.]|nr:RNA methyltransferase [Porphyromonas sp.]